MVFVAGALPPVFYRHTPGHKEASIVLLIHTSSVLTGSITGLRIPGQLNRTRSIKGNTSGIESTCTDFTNISTRARFSIESKIYLHSILN
jgi:hypothetical protein